MSRRPARCTEADIHRAVKAIQRANACMAVEISPDGTIRIVPAKVITIEDANPKLVERRRIDL